MMLNEDQFRTVYHGVADDSALTSIQEEGLQPRRLKEVYTSPDFKTASFFADHHVVEASIPPSAVVAEEPGSVLTGSIPPSQITRVHTRSDDQSWHDYRSSL